MGGCSVTHVLCLRVLVSRVTTDWAVVLAIECFHTRHLHKARMGQDHTGPNRAHFSQKQSSTHLKLGHPRSSKKCSQDVHSFRVLVMVATVEMD